MEESKGRWSLGGRLRRRSFAIGVVGAAGAIAAVRRIRRSSEAVRARGLGAFEDAPCFLEDHGLDGADQAVREFE
jgi:hypothetical protein